MYSKRSGTSSIRGQLYATKLISLLYFRAIHDDAIEDFQLASNVDNIGAFNNICFKAKVKGLKRPVAVFIQAKHRENEKQTLKNDLPSCFESYLKIRKSFELSNKDLIFKGTFDETNCLFVLYTTAKNDVTINEPVTRSFSSKLNDLISTCQLKPGQAVSTATLVGSTAMQPQKQEENVEFLCKLAMKEQVTSLAERIADLVYENENFKFSDELIQLYHVILAQKVFEVSKIQPAGHRIATFRHDFFDTNEEYLIIFKDTLFKEILKRRSIEADDVNNLLTELLDDVNDATKLSKVIGTVVIYNNGQLEFDKRYTTNVRPQLNEYVSRSTVNKAVELAAKEILLPREFKVPAAFGNRDLIISDTNVEIEEIFDNLTSSIVDLLDKCKSDNIVTIDAFKDDGLLHLNEVLASAIGNIFVFDDNTKLIKVTDKWESLESNARRLYELLTNKIHNLHEYRICMKVNKYLKLSFDFSEYEKKLARDFLNKLIFYGSQANEDGVEAFLKSEIKEYQRDHPNYFQVKADAIFLKYHDEIQKWWMKPKQAASYLTRDCDLFQQAINNIIKDLLMSSINLTYMNKIKHFHYTFTEDAVRSLNIQDHLSTAIITDNTVMTVVKVIQQLKTTEHVVLDLEYIVNLPLNDRNALRTELKNTNEGKYLIFVCDKITNSRNEKKTLENIAEAVREKNTIVITNTIKALEKLKKYFPKLDNIVHDDKNSLIDMSLDSQKRILESTRVMFQGIEVTLNLIVDDISKSYVKGEVLNKIITEETIVIGKQIVNRNYNEIKHSFVDRRLRKTGNNTDIHCKTFVDDTVDDVVLVTAEPGMGKSTLLTHLSLKTKEIAPEVWIVRINLLEYSGEFNKWKEEQTDINSLETLKFMCQVIVREKLGTENNVEIELEEENDAVYLKHCTGDQRTEFELKLFLHFYSKHKVIFLFDGFDEICPHYVNVVIKCLKNISNGPAKRMWITSRSYNEVKTILQREFGPSYEINYFSYIEMQKYLETFWERNLKLEELNIKQLENIKNFLEYMSKLKDIKLYGFAMQLHSVYVNAAFYLSSEIKKRYIPLWTHKKNYDQSFYFPVKDDFILSFHKDNRDGNPLHLLLAAAFVESSIKRVDNNDTHVWNLEDNTFTFFERFLETKIKTIRFQEKGEMNICIPDIIITCDKELQYYSLKHRKLAAYATFNLYAHKLFNEKDLEEIKDMIRFIEKGGDKTGLIDDVADGIPVFILNEYFAVEYICDRLKTANDSETQLLWIGFIFNVIFSMDSFTNICNIFDYKLKIDDTLKNALEKNDEAIFNLVMGQGRAYSEYIANMYASYPSEPDTTSETGMPSSTNVEKRYWALTDAVSQQLHNFLHILAKILKHHINKSNLNDFLDIVKGSQLLLTAYTHKDESIIALILDVVRNIDETLLPCVLRNNLLFLSDSAINSYVRTSTREVVESLLVYEDCVDSHHITLSTSSGFSSGPSTASLPSRPSTSSLAIQPSKPSVVLGPSSFNLPRRSSTSKLPRKSSVSCMSSRSLASRRRST